MNAAKLNKPPTMEIFWVRLKPYNLRKKHLLRTYMIYGLRFEEARGWYKVPKFVRTFDNKNARKIVSVNLIEKLAECHQKDEDPESPLAFDICTETEARAIDKAEKQEKKLRANAVNAGSIGQTDNPNDLTTDAVAKHNASEDEDEDEDEDSDE